MTRIAKIAAEHAGENRGGLTGELGGDHDEVFRVAGGVLAAAVSRRVFQQKARGILGRGRQRLAAELRNLSD